VFGIPVTHEDDCTRATRAALQLHEYLQTMSSKIKESTGQEIRLCSGIDTGMVVANRLNRGDQNYRIAGDVPLRADRLAVRAKPGAILMSPQSQHLATPFFETEARNPIRMKDGSRQITPYQVVSESMLQSRIEATDQERLTTYSGRNKELD